MPLAWITGGSRGIGRAVVLRLARAGYDIVFTYASQHAAATAVVAEVEALGGQAQAAALNFAHATPPSTAQNDAAIAALLQRTGCPDALVHNAGRTSDGLFAAASRDSWDTIMSCNLDSFYTVVRPVVRQMLRRRAGGRIVTLASLSGQRGNAGQVAYSASKAGLIGASKALALEVASRGITVNAVAPGLIATAMTQDIDGAAVQQTVPMRRMGTPEEVAELVWFLCSPHAGYITGQVIGINGGLCT